MYGPFYLTGKQRPANYQSAHSLLHSKKTAPFQNDLAKRYAHAPFHRCITEFRQKHLHITRRLTNRGFLMLRNKFHNKLCNTAAVQQIGKDNLIKLCTGKDSATADLTAVNDVFLQISGENDLEDITLYTVDPDSLTATVLLVSNNIMAASEPQTVSFSERQLRRLTEGNASLKLIRRKDIGWVNYSYTAIRDQDRIVGLIRITLPIRETFEARLRFLIFYVPLCVILIYAFSRIISKTLKRQIIKPILALNDAAVAYSSRDAKALESDTDTDLCFVIPDGLRNDEIGRLWQTCADMEASLNRSIGDLKHLTAEKERQLAEVEVASKIQVGMLPKADPVKMSGGRFTLYGSMNPAKGIGGDFYDYFMIDEDHLALVIGDVSGKGIPAALFMILSMTHIRTRAVGKKGPAEILTAANTGICRMNSQSMFVTVWMGIVELSTGIVKEANAGHEYPTVCGHDGKFKLKKTQNGIPLGITEDYEYAEETHTLSHGARIFVYTDGVPEVTNGSGVQFDFERMLTALNDAPQSSDEELLAHIGSTVAAFVGDAAQFDDLTMLAFSYK